MRAECRLFLPTQPDGVLGLYHLSVLLYGVTNHCILNAWLKLKIQISRKRHNYSSNNAKYSSSLITRTPFSVAAAIFAAPTSEPVTRKSVFLYPGLGGKKKAFVDLY